MSSLTPEQDAKLAKQIQILMDGGVVIPREVVDELSTAIKNLFLLHEEEKELIRKGEQRKKEVDETIKKGMELSTEIKAAIQRHETVEDQPPKVSCKKDDTCTVTLPSFKEPDYYAKLDGSGWTLVPNHHIFSKGVQKILATESGPQTRESEVKKAMVRMTHLMEHDLDLTCLDLLNAGRYLDSILWYLRNQGDWTEYDIWYRKGIQFAETLMAIKAQDPTIELDDTIYGIATTYKHYQAITKA